MKISELSEILTAESGASCFYQASTLYGEIP